MAYLYVVTKAGTPTKRLIEASSPANAIAHVAKEDYTTERVSEAVAKMIDLEIETVKPAPAAA